MAISSDKNEPIINLRNSFHKYMEKKHGMDFVTIDQFWKIPFKNKFPNLLYDIVFSLGGKLDKLSVGRDLDQKFKGWVAKQFKGSYSQYFIRPTSH